MNFFREIAQKPWLPIEGPAEQLNVRAFAVPRAALGLRVLLIALSILFTMLVVAYGDRMGLGDWRSMPKPWLLWPNTVFLILASAAMQWALTGARRGPRRRHDDCQDYAADDPVQAEGEQKGQTRMVPHRQHRDRKDAQFHR